MTGASSSLGRELCRLLHADGYNVVMVSRSAAQLAGLEKELRAQAGEHESGAGSAAEQRSRVAAAAAAAAARERRARRRRRRFQSQGEDDPDGQVGADSDHSIGSSRTDSASSSALSGRVLVLQARTN